MTLTESTHFKFQRGRGMKEELGLRCPALATVLGGIVMVMSGQASAASLDAFAGICQAYNDCLPFVEGNPARSDRTVGVGAGTLVASAYGEASYHTLRASASAVLTDYRAGTFQEGSVTTTIVGGPGRVTDEFLITGSTGAGVLNLEFTVSGTVETDPVLPGNVWPQLDFSNGLTSLP